MKFLLLIFFVLFSFASHAGPESGFHGGYGNYIIPSPFDGMFFGVGYETFEDRSNPVNPDVGAAGGAASGSQGGYRGQGGSGAGTTSGAGNGSVSGQGAASADAHYKDEVETLRDNEQATVNVLSYQSSLRNDYDRLRARDSFKPRQRTINNQGSTPKQDDLSIPHEYNNFREKLINGGSRPTFYSVPLDKDISFDKNDPSDKKSLVLYSQIQNEKSKESFKNQRYHELNFASGVVEVMQEHKEKAPELKEPLFDLAAAIKNKQTQIIISSINTLGKSEDFQKGLAVSILNNLNPASIIYPMQSNCDSGACQVGETFGDLASMLFGAVEFFGGVGASLSSGTLGISATVASGGAAAAIAAPASLAGVVYGLTMAGHGASVFNNAFGKMFERVSVPENLQKFMNSIDLMSLLKDAGVAGGKRIKEFLKASTFWSDKTKDVEELVDLTHKGTKSYFSDLMQEQHSLENVMHSDKVNQYFRNLSDYDPPFRLKSIVFEFKTVADDQWVRVYSSQNKVAGDWIMRRSEIKGLTGLDIKNKFNLPGIPTHMADVHVPTGTRMWKGEVGANRFGTSEGAIQYYLKDSLSDRNYFNRRPLSEIK